MMANRQEYILIDPPVGPYSEEQDIQAWLDELSGYPDAPEVIDARKQAEEWLEVARAE